jgi:hypothetical protein
MRLAGLPQINIEADLLKQNEQDQVGIEFMSATPSMQRIRTPKIAQGTGRVL